MGKVEEDVKNTPAEGDDGPEDPTNDLSGVTTDSDVPDNVAPVADDATFQVGEDQSVSIRLVARDPNGQALNWNIRAQPQNGFTTGEPPRLMYVPNPDFHGVDTLRFQVDDGTLASGEAVVTLEVLPISDPPIALPQQATAEEDGSVQIALAATDADGDPILAYAIPNGGPARGIAALDGHVATYTPHPDVFGSDSFVFVATSADGTSAPATVVIDVTPVNDPPSTAHHAITAFEDTQTTFSPPVNDVDDDQHTFLVLTQPRNGTAESTPEGLRYTPDPDFHGNDTFTWEVRDPSLASAVGSTQISVTPVNDPPVLVVLDQQTDEDLDHPIEVAVQDPDGDDVVVEVSTDDTSAGTVVAAADGAWLFRPAPDATGEVSLFVTATDPSLHGVSAAATLTILPIDDPPVLLSTAFELDEDGALAFALTAFDVDTPEDDLTWRVHTLPLYGQLTGTLPAGLTYTPAPDHHGDDEIVVELGDATSPALHTAVRLTTRPINDPPRFAVHNAITQEDLPIPLQVELSDPEGDLTTVICAGDCGGRLDLRDGAPWLQPLPNESGVFLLPLQACDLHGACSTVEELSAAILPANDPPVAAPAAWSVDEDQSLVAALPAVDVDGDTLTYVISSMPAHGQLVFQAGVATYTPHPNYAGPDQFTWVARDNVSSSTLAQVLIEVRPVNDPPVLRAETWFPQEDTPGFVFQVPCTDPDQQAPTYSLVTQPAHGQLTLQGGWATYVPARDYHGTDSIVLRADDGIAPAVQAVQTFQVMAVADPPSVPPSTWRTAGNTPITIAGTDGLLRGAVDPDGPDQIEAVPATVTSTLGGTVEVRRDGGFTYIPPLGVGAATDWFEFRATDSGQNEAPVAASVLLGRVVWTVDNRAAAGGDGRSATPFARLLDAQTASGPGDLIAVHPGDGTTRGMNEGIVLQPGQTLRGLERALSIDNQIIAAAANARPAIFAPTGPAVIAADNATIEQVTVTGSGAEGISIVAADGVTVKQVGVLSPTTSGVRIEDSDNVLLDGVTITSPIEAGVLVERADSPRLRSVTVNQGADHAVSLRSVRGAAEVFLLVAWQNDGDALRVRDTALDGNLALTIQRTRVLGDAITGRGVDIQLDGPATGSLSLNMTDNTVSRVQGEGVRLHLDGALDTSVTLARNVVEDGPATAFDLRFAGEVVADLTSSFDAANQTSSAPHGWSLVSADEATVLAALTGPVSARSQNGVRLLASDQSALDVLLDQPTLGASMRAVDVTREGDAALTLAASEGDLTAPFALDAHSTLGSAGATLVLDLQGNSATGSWYVLAPAANAGGPFVHLASAASVGAVGENADLGALASLGNTTLGGAPTVLFTGAVLLVPPQP